MDETIWSLTSPRVKRISGSKNFCSPPQKDFCNNICQKRTSFDNLVGAGEERRGHFEAERLGGLQIDEQLKFVGSIDRDVARLGSVEDLLHVDGKALGKLAEIRPILISPPKST